MSVALEIPSRRAGGVRVLTQTEAPLLLSLGFLAIFRAVVAKVYIVSFRTLDDRRPSKFIVLADNMRSAIKMAWETWRDGLPIALRQIHGASTGDERRGTARSVKRNFQTIIRLDLG